MPYKYSVCFDALFPGQPPEQVLPVIRDCGYDVVEFWSWWDKDLPALGRLCRSLQLDVATFCVDFRQNPGDPSQHDAYLEGLRRSIEAAQALGCCKLIAQAGWSLPHVPFDVHEAALTRVMADAVPLLERNGMTLVLEPLNTKVDHPGYHMSTSAHAFSWAEQIDSPRIQILFDLYHQQITEGNLLATIQPHLERIGHFHIAAVPGRGEPTQGELHYPNILRAIHAMGYAGYFGLEYMPDTDAATTLRAVRAQFPL